MTREEQRQLADNFLSKLLDSVSDDIDSEYTLIFKKSTIPFFTKFNVFRYEIKQYIKEFTIKNYHYGPTKDLDGYPGKIWEFGFNFQEEEIYIKFRIFEKYISCFKIHPSSKKSIRYPFK
jgi:hypothetical protein